MADIFPSSAIGLARSAATYVSELGRPADSAGIFEAVQSHRMECIGRPPTTEITKEFVGVPSKVNAFNGRLKGQLDAVADAIKGVYVVDIQITALVSHFVFEDRGRKSVEAVWQYLFDKDVNPNLMSVRVQSDDSRMTGNDGVKIKIIGMPREQTSNARARTMPDKSALSCTVRFNDGTSITTGPR